MKVVEKLQMGRLVTPIPDRRRPIYSWFQMKEAFSRDLVHLIAGTWGLRRGDFLLDPFCGVGTTQLSCKELGLDCVGFDVHPMMLLASRVKLRDYDVEELKKAVRELMGQKLEKVEAEVPGFVARVFLKSVLDDIISIREKIMEVTDEKVREFMLLGLAIAAMKCSWAHKDGAAIRVVKRPAPPLQKALKRQFLMMYHDIERFEARQANVTVELCDARKLKLGDETIDAVITSPPYLKKQEYIHAYRIEQWIVGLGGPRADELIGVRGENIEGEDFSEVAEFVGNVPLEAKLYFKDMLSAIRELYRVCRRGAKVCMVASDGCYPGGVVDVCVPLSRLAEKAGFKARRILVVNRRHCTTPQRKKVGVTREALLLWEK